MPHFSHTTGGASFKCFDAEGFPKFGFSLPNLDSDIFLFRSSVNAGTSPFRHFSFMVNETLAIASGVFIGLLLVICWTTFLLCSSEANPPLRPAVLYEPGLSAINSASRSYASSSVKHSSMMSKEKFSLPYLEIAR